MENSFITKSTQNNFFSINNSNVISKMIQSSMPISVLPVGPQNNPFSQNSMISLQPLLKAFHPVVGDFCKKTTQDDPKPNYSYIGLISMAILSTKEKKMVLSDIYQWIQDHYSYFQTRGPGWRNSIRHNLSLNDCFVKVGRSSNGKGHYWGIHPANIEDFKRGDFRRRRAQRKVRRALGLTCPDEDDTPSPSPTHSPKAFDWPITGHNETPNFQISDNSIHKMNSIIHNKTENDIPLISNSGYNPYFWPHNIEDEDKLKLIKSSQNSRTFDIENILNPVTKKVQLKEVFYNQFFSHLNFLNILNGIRFARQLPSTFFRENQVHQFLEFKHRAIANRSVNLMLKSVTNIEQTDQFK